MTAHRSPNKHSVDIYKNDFEYMCGVEFFEGSTIATFADVIANWRRLVIYCLHNEEIYIPHDENGCVILDKEMQEMYDGEFVIHPEGKEA